MSRGPQPGQPGRGEDCRLGRPHRRRLGGRDRRGGRRDQPRRAQRQLPLHRQATCAEIMDSRVDSTRAVGEAIAQAARPPRVWLQMSTATIYAHRFDAPNDEATGLIGGGEPDAPDYWRFSIDVAQGLGADARARRTRPRTRKVALRTAMVMSPDRGRHLRHAARPRARCGLGGAVGGRAAVRLLDPRAGLRARGRVPARARRLRAARSTSPRPNPLPQREFMRGAARGVGHRRSGCPRRSGCSRSAPSSCARRPSCC